MASAQELRLRFRTGRPHAPPLDRIAARDARIQQIDREVLELTRERLALLAPDATDGT